MPKFLIYQNEQDAWDRADVEGKALNLPYWQDPENVTRTTSYPIYTLDAEWGLEVTDYITLTEEESEASVDSLNLETE